MPKLHYPGGCVTSPYQRASVYIPSFAHRIGSDKRRLICLTIYWLIMTPDKSNWFRQLHCLDPWKKRKKMKGHWWSTGGSENKILHSLENTTYVTEDSKGGSSLLSLAWARRGFLKRSRPKSRCRQLGYWSTRRGRCCSNTTQGSSCLAASQQLET